MAPAPSSLYAGAFALEGLRTIVNILQDISGDLPVPASTVINLVQRLITTLDDVQSNRDECELLRTRLLELLPVVMMAIQSESTGVSGQVTIPADLKGNVERFQRNLENIEKEVTEIAKVANSNRKRHKLTAVFWVKSHAASLKSCRDDLEWAMNLFNASDHSAIVSSHLSDAVRLWETSKKVEQVLSNQSMMSKKTQKVLTNQFLESLPRAKYASFDCERPDKPSKCFQGTRTSILKLITEWITDPGPAAARFFWLNGIAGVGKTTVACTVASLMQDLGLLGGQFCFSRRGEAELRNPALVFPTIAYQLARFDPEFSRRITAALEIDPDAPYAALKEQLDRLIIKPLAGLERDPKRVVVLIFDAFDECEARGAKEILQLLVAAIPSLPFFLKVLVTSRPENHIRSVLVPAADAPGSKLQITALHDIEASIVKGDILLYLRDRLKKLPEELGQDLPPGWVTDAEIELLAKKAGNLFIHAATALRFLSKAWDLREQLDILLALLISPHHPSDSAQPFAELDQLYTQILLGLIPPGSGPQIPSRLRLVLGSIVLLRDPLPVAALERLIGVDPGKIVNSLNHLHSVVLTPLPPDDCPRVYHPSFPDFLQDPSRCTSDQIRIDTEEHERRMALQCLKLLNAKLHKGMLGDLDPTLLNSEVEDLHAKIKNAFPPELQYACRYWASHLANTHFIDSELAAALEIFASRWLLPWLEAMSWLGDTGLAIHCLEAVNSWQIKHSNALTTATLLNDGYRLLLARRPTLALGAQHLATSIIPFAPPNTALTTQYAEYGNSNVRVIGGVHPDWSPCLMVLEGHQDVVRSVAYSSDGSRAASASDDKTIRLWDTTTGNCTATFEGHFNVVTSVAFYPDGITLASGSWDGTIRTWDTTTGVPIAVLEGHSGFVNSVAFSCDGSQLASGSSDKTIQIWDMTTGMTIATFQGHSDCVRSVAFSPDGSHLASGSDDETIRIWDMTGRCITTLKDHSDKVSSVKFSPNGSYLASGSGDNTVRIWDTATRRCTFTFEGHSEAVNDVAFSPDGTRLASVSNDETIRIWDTATRGCVNTLRGHSSGVSSITFSSNGSRLISGSWDNAVRIWDATTVNPTAQSEGHLDYIPSVAFSKDGSRLVSASWDKTARIWDATTGRCLTTLEGHSDKLRSVAFHPDGSQIATGSNDQTVRLWDANTGECIATLGGHSNWATSLAFSTDGSYLKSTDKSYLKSTHDTYFWDVATVKRVEEPDDSQYQFVISPPTPFKIDDGRLMKTCEDGYQRLVCLLPPGTSAGYDSVASFAVGGGRHRVAIGCLNGDVVILEIRLPLD